MKSLLVSVIFVFLNFSGKAQLKMGLEAGFSLSSWIGTFKDFEYKSGFYAGGKAVYYFNDELLIESGVFFSQEGWKDEVVVNNEEVTQIMTLNYLILPIEVGVFGFGDRYGGLRFNFGIEFKHLLNYELVNELSSGKEQINFSVDISSFDIPLKIGMDYKIDENLGLSFQGYIGVVKINKSFTPELRRMYNQGFRFGLYYLF